MIVWCLYKIINNRSAEAMANAGKEKYGKIKFCIYEADDH